VRIDKLVYMTVAWCPSARSAGIVRTQSLDSASAQLSSASTTARWKGGLIKKQDDMNQRNVFFFISGLTNDTALRALDDESLF
jgi:hypothetical protein